MTVRTTKPAMVLRAELARIGGLALAIEGLLARVGALEASVYSGVFAESGWQRLPSGLIIQWGLANANGTSAFPVAFPAACLQAIASDNDDGTPTTMGVQMTASHITISSSESPGVARYIAIGY